MQRFFQMGFGYNAWANRRLYDTVAGLTDAERAQDLRAFFRSVTGTLNHLVVTDTLWLDRIEGRLPSFDRLDACPFPDFTALRAVRADLDARLIALAAGLELERLEAPLYFTTTAGVPRAQPLASVLAHVINHQTHHRGQVSDLVSRLGHETPVLDMMVYQNEAGDFGM